MRKPVIAALLVCSLPTLAATNALAVTPRASGTSAVAAYWTPARLAAAIPRDIVVDPLGRSLMAGPDGALSPYGLDKALAQAEKGKPGTSLVTSDAHWTKGGTVQTTAGRLFFVMDGLGWVCSGSTASDSRASISVILTAAHCVYDDANKAFATNVMFIPDLDASGIPTQATCDSGYVHGCWAPSYGVVAADWSARTWPDNIPYDYGVYVVPNAGSHTGTGGGSDLALDSLGSLAVEWQSAAVTLGTLTDAIGYTYKVDPQLRYCEQALGSITGVPGYQNRWLSSCRLGGGSSGGPWMAASPAGEGPIISVNSWGYQGKPGMAGPNLQAAEPKCVFDTAVSDPRPTDGGVTARC